MAVQNRSQTFKNAKRTAKIALTFISKGEMTFTIQANVQVFKERMVNSEYIGILLLEVNTIKSDVAVDVEVAEGITSIFRSPRWKDFVMTLLKELRTYRLEDIC